MAVDGTWNITLKTPIGDRAVTVTLNSDGNDLSGTLHGPQGEQAFEGGTASGDEATWNAMFNGAMGEMKLGFVGSVDGDAIDGTVQFGVFGSGTFSGTRA
ncbi:MAG: hypothetical protein ACYTFT_16895 [Planctomycetota bacterium]|jgi:hypothetical protein